MSLISEHQDVQQRMTFLDYAPNTKGYRFM
uniref:Uncharacterized protein n=1 Tax=Moniliophthora roreri TaxID=221103 RepID=A0A0W0FBD3_MONRR